ncbi:MAG: S8 family serine peptidase [Candidatus Synoicihabitans palmerolidicus]|nr:S8 family serine peptidase [Candidatus Synoicihabitans palmerolidicus]
MINGTSMASPSAAGEAALVISAAKQNNLDHSAVRSEARVDPRSQPSVRRRHGDTGSRYDQCKWRLGQVAGFAERARLRGLLRCDCDWGYFFRAR